MKFVKTLLTVQGAYTFITAVWPLIDIDSFMAVTGPKHDIWLVKTVGALLIPVSVCMLMNVFVETDRKTIIVLSLATAGAFVCIDFYYALNDVISAIYMADGVLQILFILGWSYILIARPGSK